MERDFELIREICQRLESHQHTNKALYLEDFDSSKKEEIAYNVTLMVEAKLVEGEIRERPNRTNEFIITRLTWSGHEFFDAIRNDAVWEKTKALFKEKGVGMTVDLVISGAKAVAISLLGLAAS